jgi:hypothetical protein
MARDGTRMSATASWAARICEEALRFNYDEVPVHRRLSLMDATVDKEDRITLVCDTRIVYPGTMFGDGINARLRERDGCDRCLDT